MVLTDHVPGDGYKTTPSLHSWYKSALNTFVNTLESNRGVVLFLVLYITLNIENQLAVNALFFKGWL